MNYAFKIKRVLYGLEQASRAWYDRLTFLLGNDFVRGNVDAIIFCKNHNKDFIIVNIYVDDIIFRSLCKDFSMRKSEFEMSMIWELKFFLGL